MYGGKTNYKRVVIIVEACSQHTAVQAMREVLQVLPLKFDSNRQLF